MIHLQNDHSPGHAVITLQNPVLLDLITILGKQSDQSEDQTEQSCREWPREERGEG